DLVSIDALQEFKVVTSGSPPEFGRSPGGQISLVTRSGTNEFHGALFHNFRNDALDASDWFANRNGLQKPQLRQNEFGGVLGGPLLLPRLADGALHLHNSRRLFFFFSYEGMRLRQPQVVNTELPSLSTRQRAATGLKPFLDAFPIPNGPELANPGLAEFAAAYSNPSRLDAISIRLDHTVNDSLQIFVRYNDAPSENDTRSTITPSVSERTILNTRTLTLGGTLSLRPKITADFRFNYSRTEYDDSSSLDAFGGAVPLSASQIFPSFASPADSQIAWDINFVNSTGLPNLLPTIDYSRLSGAIAVGRNAKNLQRQFNLVDNLSVSAGKHQLKFGLDYRRMAPKYAPPVYLQGSVFDDAVAVETGITSIVTIEARNEAAPLLHNFSAFLQDSWRAGSRLTLVYGMRWELNPSPSANGGVLPYTAIGLDDPATMRLAPENSPLWKTTYRNFAPRLGVTYQVSQTSNHETILRAGLGLYYDLGPGFALAGYTSPPFIRSAGLVNEPFPVNPSRAMPPPPGSLQPPYGGLTVIDPELKLPYTMQWNLAVEH
ncbi:MAG: TonB-dependent receptor, partial [Blastocatellia bacterium]|nr:TonB-dependent receptor [Blastocatellia bacterium]